MPAPRPTDEPKDPGNRFTLLLAALALFIFVLYPLLGSGLVLDAAFSIVLLSGLYAVSQRHAWTAAAGVVTVCALSMQWARLPIPEYVRQRVEWGAAGILLIFVAGVVLWRVLHLRRVTQHTLAGALSVYLLLGLIWALAFSMVEHVAPGSIRFQDGGGAAFGSTHWQADVLYFSLVTLTTLGYGDIVPVSPVAKTLATAEALIGQLFLAVMIARLVALEVANRLDTLDSES